MSRSFPLGTTDLDPNEKDGLLLPIRTREELNNAEDAAIREARRWALKSRKLQQNLLSISGMKLLHKRMFETVWEWAGSFRHTEKNIGIDPFQVPMQLEQLCKNFEYRTNGILLTHWPRLASEFYHGLVYIHAFPNGNGRHGRLATELLSKKLSMPSPDWGLQFESDGEKLRRLHIEALQDADRGSFGALEEFLFSMKK